MQRHSVRAVILDEAQHLMTVGSGKQGSVLLDQLDWIKSMTNVTDIVHILIGTYDLLSFTHLNGQASRRGLPIHFPRYQLQREEDCLQFQAALLALLHKVPLQTDAETLVIQHWLYFYECCIGCIGILKDWLLRAVSAALDDDADALTLDYLHAHALDIAQCEQMALDAIEGEQKLSYNEGRREHLWRLLQGVGDLVALPVLPKSEGETLLASTPLISVEPAPASAPKDIPVKKTQERVGQRTPMRDPVGETMREEKSLSCPFSGVIDVEPTRLTQAGLSKVECPECGAVRTVRIQGNSSIFPSHPKRKTNTTRNEGRWIKQRTEWTMYTKGKE